MVVAQAFACLGTRLTAEHHRHDTIADTSPEGTPLRVPRARVCERGAFRFSVMPKRLKRIYGFGHLRFLTFSCYRRLPLLRSARVRSLFVRVLHKVREEYGF